MSARDGPAASKPRASVAVVLLFFAAGTILSLIAVALIATNTALQLQIENAEKAERKAGAVEKHPRGVHETVIEHRQTLIRHRVDQPRRPQPFVLTNTTNLTTKVDSTMNGKCPSPEKDVAWILDGSCLDREIRSSSPRLSPKRTCGLCGEETAYLRTLRNKLEAQYKEKCEELVVYGAAIGSKYVGWLQNPSFFDPNAKRAVDQHGTCMFSFVGDGGDPGTAGNQPYYSADKSQIIIYIDVSKLPYTNNRRNVKLLKLNPGLLFPWAKRIIWQDTKLLRSGGNDMPVDYLGHFRSTIERFGVCSSFMGLPDHPWAISGASSVNLMAHCDTIISAAQRRPTVSDSLEILHAQCQSYYNIHENRTDPRSQVFHQHPLIDSAFMLFDMQSERCRQYNEGLLCSWLDDIHCYTDRDQVSFSSVLAFSDVQLVPTGGSGDKVYANQDDIPMVHIANRNCHWYFHRYAHCIGQDLTLSSVNIFQSTGEMTPPRKVAVIVAGTMQRFLFRSTIAKLIDPMVASGIDVDYYLSLITSKTKAYRSNSGYTDHAVSDLNLHGDRKTSIVDSITESLAKSRANARVISIQEDIDIDEDKLLTARRESAKAKHPDEDPDLRFPILDLRSEEIRQRTVVANRNLLKKHFAIQSLWREAEQWEEHSGKKYDIIIFMSDDSYWISEFKLDELLSFGKRDDDVFVLSCDARNPPMHPQEINDHILISKRSSADTFGSYYTKLFEIDSQQCMNRLDKRVTSNMRRGCNSEMLLKYVMDTEEVQTRKVPQSLIPFQRSVNVEMPDRSTKICFHKFCQSKWSPVFTNGTGLCKDVDWSQIFSEQ